MSKAQPLLPNASGSLVDDGITICWRNDNDEAVTSSCLCFWPQQSHISHISNHSILFCEVVPGSEDVFSISYLSFERDHYKLKNIILQINGVGYQDADIFADQIMTSAYTGTFNQPKILLLLNTKGGKGNASLLYKNKIKPVLDAAHIEYTCIETNHSGHASEIAEDLDIDEYDIIACCSGDGIPHEFINGLYRRPDCAKALNKLAITQLPCGSGNAFAWSTFGTNDTALATLEMLKLTEIKMDLMLIKQGNKSSLSFLSQAYGAIADSDIGTEHLRWMGSLRFELGLAYLIFSKAKYPCDLYVKNAIQDKAMIEEHFKLYNRSQSENGVSDAGLVTPEKLKTLTPDINSSVPSDWELLPKSETEKLSMFYVGKMPYVLSDAQFFPAAISDDGYMDMLVFNSKIPFLEATNLLLSVSEGGHVNHKDVRHAKISAYRLVPRVDPKKHYISVDGENFPVEPLQVEILPRVLLVLLRDRSFVDTRFGEH